MEYTELSLDDLREVELGLLKEFRDFCIENNLKFLLSNGTLLGAVKYKGFIPWDDDIDIFIPRKDYDFLIENYKDSNQFKLFSPERVKEYAFPFAKLCDMKTRREETNNNNGVELGVDIDIFPLDMWDENAKKQAKKQAKRMLYLRLAKNQKISSPKLFKSIPKKTVAIFCKMFGASFFITKLQKEAIKSKVSKNMGCVIWPVYGEKEIIPEEVFADSTEVVFEGEKFPAPIGYDLYLRSLYSDYEKDPPEEKQKTHHLFVAYRL